MLFRYYFDHGERSNLAVSSSLNDQTWSVKSAAMPGVLVAHFCTNLSSVVSTFSLGLIYEVERNYNKLERKSFASSDCLFFFTKIKCLSSKRGKRMTYRQIQLFKKTRTYFQPRVYKSWTVEGLHINKLLKFLTHCICLNLKSSEFECTFFESQ